MILRRHGLRLGGAAHYAILRQQRGERALAHGGGNQRGSVHANFAGGMLFYSTMDCLMMAFFP